MRQRTGIALVITLVLVAVVGIAVLGSSFSALVSRQTAGRQQGANAAYYVAQAGLNDYKTRIFRNLVDYYAENQAGWCESPLAGGIVDEAGNVVLEPGETTAPTAFGIGTYTITFDLSGQYLILTSVGQVGNHESVLQLVATAGGGPASAWDNAVMANGYEGGANTNGNVSIHGSVHIVGDYELGNPDLTPSGSVGIYNDYFGNGTGNSNIITPLTGVVTSTDVDLCTRVKMKSGSLYLHGSAQVGADGHDIYGVSMHTGRVFNGKKGQGNPQEITGECDLDNNPGGANQRIYVKNPLDCNEPFPHDYVPTYDLALPQLDAAYPNDLESVLELSECTEFTAALTGSHLTLPPPTGFTCSDGENELSWRAIDGVMRLVIAGNVNLGAVDVAVTAPIEYVGMGRMRQGSSKADTGRTFVVSDSIRPYGGGYPTTNVLGLETTGNVTFNPTAASPIVAMVMFAQGLTDFQKQVILLGSIVTTEFSVDKQVPTIAYHPDIRTVAEQIGMVGSCEAEQCNPGVLADISVERRDRMAIE